MEKLYTCIDNVTNKEVAHGHWRSAGST